MNTMTDDERDELPRKDRHEAEMAVESKQDLEVEEENAPLHSHALMLLDPPPADWQGEHVFASVAGLLLLCCVGMT